MLATIVALCVGALAVSGPFASPAGGEAQSVRFSIAPQPLGQAIEAYSVASGVTVLYEQPATAQIKSPGVSGVFSAQAALQALLVGTGLTVRFTDAHDAVLMPLASVNQTAPSTEPPPTDGPTLTLDTLHVEAPPRRLAQWVYDQYARVVQADIERAISRSINAPHTSYRVVLELWIDGSGKVDHARLLGSTGQPQLDLALSRVVSATVLDRAPPAGLLQPVSVEVRMRAGFS
jgi:TonB family protein